MVSVTALLDEAEAQGLDVRAEANRLVIVGPASAVATAEGLLKRKAEVLAALRGSPCPRCAGSIGWRTADGSVRCAGCHGRPHGAEKVLLITLTGGNTAWVDFAEDLAIHRARMAAKQA